MKNKVFYLFILFFFSSGVVNAQIGPGGLGSPSGLGGTCSSNTDCSSGSCFISGDPADGGFGTCVDGIDSYGDPRWQGHCYFYDADTTDDYDPNYDPDDPGIENITDPCAISSPNDDQAIGVRIEGCYVNLSYCGAQCISGYIPRGLEENAQDDIPLSACEPQSKFCLETDNDYYDTAHSTLCPGNETGIQNLNESDRSSVLRVSCPTYGNIVNRSPKCQKTCNPGYMLKTSSLNGMKSCVIEPEPIPTPSLNNVFGWAWSSNVGWLKMSYCDDLNSDGLAYEIEGCYNTHYGVRINNSSGDMSGYAWNNNVGWIKFGGNNSSGGIGGTNANLNISSGSNIGTFSGWARFVSGFTGHIFDGWVSFSGSNYLSGVMDGSRGLTYDKSKRLIVGSAWGGEVIGWIKFGDGTHAFPRVTYGVIPDDYLLTATPPAPPFHVFSAGESPQVTFSTVSVREMPGFPAPLEVVLSTELFGNSSNGITISFTENPNCTLPCGKKLKIVVTSAASPGLYSIGITASPTSVPIKTVTINFIIPTDADTTDPSFRASCYPTPVGGPFYVNQPITWKLEITGATSRHSVFSPVTLKGTNIPGAGQTMKTLNQSATPTIFTATKTYSTTGVKNANVSVQYTIPPPPASQTTQPIPTTNTVTCTPVTVLVQPNTNEF